MLAIIASSVPLSPTEAFTSSYTTSTSFNNRQYDLVNTNLQQSKNNIEEIIHKTTSLIATAALSVSLILGTCSTPAFAENELVAKFGGKGVDLSLVDQTCLVDKCSLQAKACLKDDPECRKGLACTMKW